MPTEPEGFSGFVVAKSPSLLRFGWLLTGNWATAEDLLQTALANAWPRWQGIDPAAMESYVRTSMARTYVTWWRRRSAGEIAVAAVTDSTVDDAAALVDLRRDVVAALARLPRRQRAVVVMRYYLDLGEADVARELSCSVGTVKSQAAKALAHLRADPALRSVFEDVP
jgi:RNA polymerase sigma-70 factor (sigma-E family)